MKVTSQLIVLGALCHAVLGKPVSTYSVMDSADVWESQLEGKLPLSRRDMSEIARRARIVNAASCPPTTAPVPLPVRGLPEGSVVVASSDDAELEELREEVDLGWYIAHSPSTNTLTLAISSLPTVDDLLVLLASQPEDGDELVQLPLDIYPGAPEDAKVQHSLFPAFASHGLMALSSLLDIIDNPPPPPQSIVPDWAWRLIGRNAPSGDIERVEVIGHGLGASLGLLVSLALESSDADVEIMSTLFSLPRTGNAAFSSWVDSLQSPSWQLRRITSYADTIPHLPGVQRGFTQPKQGEIWVGADPRTAYACLGFDGHESCSESIPLARTKLEDFDGPFGGVWIEGVQACGHRFDLSNL